MTSNMSWHPDLLRRFVSTPYIFSQCDGLNQFCVQSNDLEIALSVRRSCITQDYGKETDGLLCRFIRDRNSPADDSEIAVVSDGPLQVLYLGQGTILIYDRERSELLGFISRNVTPQKLVSSLIPAVLNL